jgi:pyrroloquinoline quinone biosynthesis protein E
MNGWGNVFLTIAPDGTALPCHSARDLPGMHLPNVRDQSIREIWEHSGDFNRFRGLDWMKEPCRSCEEKTRDFGGCRCQAYLMTGDPANADPVCAKSPHHHLVDEAITQATMQAASQGADTQPLLFRNPQNSKLLHGK